MQMFILDVFPNLLPMVECSYFSLLAFLSADAVFPSQFQLVPAQGMAPDASETTQFVVSEW